MVTNPNTTPVKAQAAPSASPKTTGMVSGNAPTKTQAPETTQASTPATSAQTTAKQSAPVAAKTAAPAKTADSKPATPAPQTQPTKPVTDATVAAKPKTVITTRQATQDNVVTPKVTEATPVVEQSAPTANEQTTASTTDVATPVNDASVAESNVAPTGTPAGTQNTELAANPNGGSAINTDDYAAKNVQVIAAQGSQLMAAKENRERMAKLQLDTTATAKPIHITVNYTNGGKTISSVSETVQGGQPLDIQGHMPSGYQVSGPFSTGTVIDGQTVNVPVVPVSSGTQATMRVTVDYDYNGKTVASVPMTVDNGSTIDVAGHIPSGYQSAGTWDADSIKDGDTLHVPVVPTNSSNTNNSDTSNSGSSTTNNGSSSSTNTTPSTSTGNSDNSGSQSGNTSSMTPSGTTDNGSSTDSQVTHFTVKYEYNGQIISTYLGTLTGDETFDPKDHVPAGYKLDLKGPHAGNPIKDGEVMTYPVVPINGSTGDSGNSSSTPATGSGSSSSDSSQSSDNSSSNGSQSSSDNSQSGSQNTTPANGSSSSNDNSQSSTDESDIPLTINWVDKTTGKTIGSTQVELKPESTNDISSLCPKGYRIDGSWNQQNITKDTKTADVPVVPITNSNSSSAEQNTDGNKKGINIDVSANAHAKAKGKASANVNVNADNKAKGQGAATGNAKSCGMSCGLGATANCDMGDAAPVEGMGAVEAAPAAAAASQYAEVPETIEVPANGQGDVAMPATGQKHGSILADLAAAAVTLIGGSALLKRRNG